MAINETINKIRQRGKFNLNTAKAQFEALQPTSYPDDGQPAPPATEIGRWDFYADYDYSGPIADGQIRSLQGDAATSNQGIIINPIDKNSNNTNSFLETIESQTINLTWFDGTNTHVIPANFEYDGTYVDEWIIFWAPQPSSYNFGTYPSDGTEIILSIGNPGIPPSPQASFLYIKDHADYKGGTGIASGADPISVINVQGKDTYLKVDFEIFPAYGVITSGQPFVYDQPSTLFIQLGNGTGSGGYPNNSTLIESEYFYKPTSLGQRSVKGSMILTEKLEDWEWIKLAPWTGRAPVIFEEGSGSGMIYNLRFTNKNIKKLIL